MIGSRCSDTHIATQAWRFVVAYSLFLILLDCLCSSFAAFAPRTAGLIDHAAWQLCVWLVEIVAYPQHWRAAWVSNICTLGMVGIAWGILRPYRKQWARTLQGSLYLVKRCLCNLITVLWTCVSVVVKALGTTYNSSALA